MRKTNTIKFLQSQSLEDSSSFHGFSTRPTKQKQNVCYSEKCKFVPHISFIHSENILSLILFLHLSQLLVRCNIIIRHKFIVTSLRLPFIYTHSFVYVQLLCSYLSTSHYIFKMLIFTFHTNEHKLKHTHSNLHPELCICQWNK